MKTGMELLKEILQDGKHLWGDAFLTNQANADLLQAWLREADVALDRAERSRGTVLLAWVRQKLLGTNAEPTDSDSPEVRKAKGAM